jgi:hypothetical protein
MFRFDSRRYQIFWEVVRLERGILSFVSTTEELLGGKSNGSGLEIREYGRRDPSRCSQELLPLGHRGGPTAEYLSKWTGRVLGFIFSQKWHVVERNAAYSNTNLPMFRIPETSTKLYQYVLRLIQNCTLQKVIFSLLTLLCYLKPKIFYSTTAAFF